MSMKHISIVLMAFFFTILPAIAQDEKPTEVPKPKREKALLSPRPTKPEKDAPAAEGTQEKDPADRRSAGWAAATPKTHRAEDLETRVLNLKHTMAADILRPISRLYARNLMVERGEEINTMQNIVDVASTNSIIICDTKDVVREIAAMVTALDVSADENTGAKPAKEPRPMLMDYTPRHLSINDVTGALQPFMHTVRIYENGAVYDVQNVSFVKDRSVVVMRDQEAVVREMRDLLERLDVPKTQVLVTCTIVEGTDSADVPPARLPEDVTKSLSELTGFKRFKTVANGMVRTTVKADRPVEMSMATEFAKARVTFKPSAYDPATRTVTLDGVGCTISQVEMIGQAQPPVEQSFQTTTSLPAEEYTVIGASGGAPVYVLLRLSFSK